jgi:hypothetical protein
MRLTMLLCIFDPIVVLCKDNNGIIFAKLVGVFVVLRNLIRKILVTNTKVIIQQ